MCFSYCVYYDNFFVLLLLGYDGEKNDSENETEMIILFISGELAAVIGRLAEPFGSPGCSYGQLYATRQPLDAFQKPKLERSLCHGTGSAESRDGEIFNSINL